jgi:hypothetical protein
MKLFTFLVLILLSGSASFAQWIDTNNTFNDSLHMPVCQATATQDHPIVLKSGTDGGYFIFWEDTRNTATSKTDIYAQKYDKDGKRLWAEGGIPVAAGPLDERIEIPQNIDYRSYSSACIDGDGGFYIAWTYMTQIGSYNYYGVAAQHIRSNGAMVFPADGYKVATPNGTTNTQFTYPQVVSDDNKGFYIGYLSQNNSYDVYAYRLKDEGGAMHNYGGGQMDKYGEQRVEYSQCGDKFYVDESRDAHVESFNLYPDLQGGCNIAMTMSTNVQQYYVGFNRLCLIKKDCQATVVKRRGGEVADTEVKTITYKKDSVVRLYNYKTFSYTTTCSDLAGNVYVYTNYKIENNGYGFLQLNVNPKYYAGHPLGVVLPTGGNINAEFISTLERSVSNNAVTPYILHGYYRLNEIYDSIPYQFCSDLDHPYEAYRPIVPDNAEPLDTIYAGPDTVMAHNATYEYNYSMAGTASKIWLTADVYAFSEGTNSVYLQELNINHNGDKHYAFAINTADKYGVKIGQEINGTGFTGTNITYNVPAIAVDKNGHGLFYIVESGRYVRVSPIADSARLPWGAMGKPMGTGYWQGYPYGPVYAHAVLDDNGNGLVAWDDSRHTPISTGENIWMNKVSNVFTPTDLPPYHTVQLLYPDLNLAQPNFFTGTSFAWTTVESGVYDRTVGTVSTSPVVAMVDNYPLGAITVYTFQNGTAIRNYDNKPYLDRNFTIYVANNPDGAGNIPVRLFFTTAEFNALKAADPSILTPGDLSIVKQPNAGGTSSTVPKTYTPIAGEETLSVQSWAAVNGGYYIQTTVKGFSNFFIFKGTSPLPLTWLDIKGKLTAPAEAAITCTVTDEQLVKDYTVQYSIDGITYQDGCTEPSLNTGVTTVYSCTTTLPAINTYYFRVRQTDEDGRTTYSKVIILKPSGTAGALAIGPNPAHAQAILQIPTQSVVRKLILVTNSGRTVWQSSGIQSLTGDVAIPLAQLPAGIYHLQVIHDKGVEMLKIVKQ